MDEENQATAQASPAEARRAQWLLALGAVLGLALASAGLMSRGDRGEFDLPDDAVAVVNGTPIRRADYERLMAGLASDSRNPIDDKARRHVLDRMIDEELLVQRGLELGLASVDRRVRSDLTSNLIQSVVTGAEEVEPTHAGLEAFHSDNAEFFTRPGRLRVRQIYFRVGPDTDESKLAARVVTAHAALVAGRDFADARQRFGDSEVSPIPDAMLPALKLREYVGPSVMEVARALEVGEFSEPVRSGTGIHIINLVDAEPAWTPPLDQIESQVRSEWRRRRGDEALRAYLDALRADSDVRTSDRL